MLGSVSFSTWAVVEMLIELFEGVELDRLGVLEPQHRQVSEAAEA